MNAVSPGLRAALRAASLLISAACGVACAAPNRCLVGGERMPSVRTPAPPPFTIEEIRSAMQVGRKDRFVTVGPEMAPTFGEVEVVTAKDDAYQLHTEGFEVPG